MAAVCAPALDAASTAVSVSRVDPEWLMATTMSPGRRNRAAVSCMCESEWNSARWPSVRNRKAASKATAALAPAPTKTIVRALKTSSATWLKLAVSSVCWVWLMASTVEDRTLESTDSRSSTSTGPSNPVAVSSATRRSFKSWKPRSPSSWHRRTMVDIEVPVR